MADDEHIAVTNTVWVNVIEITQERDELRETISRKDDEYAAQREITYETCRANDALRAEVERLTQLLETERRVAHMIAMEHKKDAAEVERLRRENGALARTYALSEGKLRERTERSNDAESQVTTLEWQLSEATKEIGRLRAALEHMVDVFSPLARMGAGGPAVEEARDALGRDNCC
jgi:chromosome segregation ATPase